MDVAVRIGFHNQSTNNVIHVGVHFLFYVSMVVHEVVREKVVQPRWVVSWEKQIKYQNSIIRIVNITGSSTSSMVWFLHAGFPRSIFRR